MSLYSKIIGAFLHRGNHWVLLVRYVIFCVMHYINPQLIEILHGCSIITSSITYLDPKGEEDTIIKQLTEHWKPEVNNFCIL